jgi:hypothetical protein
LLTLAPPLLIGVLSTHPEQQALELHYAAEAVPIAAIAAVLGARRLASRWSPASVMLVLLLPALTGFAMLSPLSPFDAGHYAAPTASHRQAVDEAIALVPAEASASAQSGLAARLSQRREIYEFPRAGTAVAWVIVDAFGHRTNQSIQSGYDETLRDVRQQYELAFARDGVEVFRARQP